MLLRNPFRRLQDLVAAPPTQVGDVDYVSDGVATITLLGGGKVNARGPASAGDRVFVQGGVIQGPAPTLALELIEV